jgi:magnesium transporter
MGRRTDKGGHSRGKISSSRPKAEKTRITVIDYDADNFLEKEVENLEECIAFHETSTVTWINVDGVHDSTVIEKLGGCFGIHPLILEDIMTTSERPKIEDLGDMIYIVFQAVDLRDAGLEVDTEQLSLVLGKNFVLTFQERPGDAFDPVRDRIRRGKGRLRKMGPDYLAYALLDAAVDDYFVALEKIGERIDGLEDELVVDPRKETLNRIHSLRREMIYLRKAAWPLREMVGGLQRLESPLIQGGTNIFLRDVYDHTIQVIDSIETFREMLSGMLETYLSSLSNRMNEVMKVLTIIATIFIPLTFIAGVYGMNFKFMPELEWRWGYFVVWGLMLIVGVLMALYFKRKKWL